MLYATVVVAVAIFQSASYSDKGVLALASVGRLFTLADLRTFRRVIRIDGVVVVPTTSLLALARPLTPPSPGCRPVGFISLQGRTLLFSLFDIAEVAVALVDAYIDASTLTIFVFWLLPCRALVDNASRALTCGRGRASHRDRQRGRGLQAAATQ